MRSDDCTKLPETVDMVHAVNKERRENLDVHLETLNDLGSNEFRMCILKFQRDPGVATVYLLFVLLGMANCCQCKLLEECKYLQGDSVGT